jgi:hypothetical protein
LCFAAGCATPIGVNHVDRSVAYHSFTANAISAERASSFSARELINFNLFQEFEDNPKKALADLHAGLAPKGDEDRIFALAELSFLHAQKAAIDLIIWRQPCMLTHFFFPDSEARRPGESTRDCGGR